MACFVFKLFILAACGYQVFSQIVCILDLQCSAVCDNPAVGQCTKLSGTDRSYCTCNNTCSAAAGGTHPLIACTPSTDFGCQEGKSLTKCGLKMGDLPVGYICCSV